ncbi:hypothetical protein AWB92_12465 [Mycobacterium sp. IEC1808]|uniref:hypothetical protein n=1 Tax=Mycobacterium sp. IEC1808 TaxID=1743230 RepID=UPI000A151FF8|nr:hypothetical protein [Mycobacterium sp. IEC1808]ORW93943.1 hypothetical protein AWB92_12465 [Mycobacterium sp. IEC1808]
MTARVVVVGIAGNGRSAILTDKRLQPEAISFTDAATRAALEWKSAEQPPREAAVLFWQLWPLSEAAAPEDSPPATGDGEISWSITSIGPHSYIPMHATCSVDHCLVLSGTVALESETGEAWLRTGHAVTIVAASHAWRAGQNGCTIATLSRHVEQR